MFNLLSIPAFGGFALFFVVLYKYLLFPVFLSPLSKIPNAHFTSCVSPAWILWKRYRCLENRTIHAAHQRHGSIVRLAPNELSVNCVDGGIRTIYGGGFDKSEWYSDLFTNYGVPNMFTMVDGKAHSIRKRMLSNVYSKSYVQSSLEMNKLSESLLFDRYLPILDASAKNGTHVDVHELNFAVAMDFITAYLFGLDSGTDFLGDVHYRKHWLQIYDSRRSYEFWAQELPEVTSFLSKIGIPMVPNNVRAANLEMEDWCLKLCEKAAATQRHNTTDPSAPGDANKPHVLTVHTQLSQSFDAQAAKSSPVDPPSQPADLPIASEMMDHILAGHETIGVTMTYLLYEMSLHPALQASLRTELLTLSPPLKFPNSVHPCLPPAQTIDTLPLLTAVVTESLRRHGALPGPQPRLTPHNPATPTTLAGYTNIPGGVRVSAQAYTLHRNEEVFPKALEWRPERWLEADKNGERARWFWAFGSGGRGCIGRWFALQEMKLLVAAIYTNYTTSVVDDTGMEQNDGFIGGPRGNRLILKFERVAV